MGDTTHPPAICRRSNPGAREGRRKKKEKKRDSPNKYLRSPPPKPDLYGNPIVTKCRAFLGSALDQDFTFVF